MQKLHTLTPFEPHFSSLSRLLEEIQSRLLEEIKHFDGTTLANQEPFAN